MNRKQIVLLTLVAAMLSLAGLIATADAQEQPDTSAQPTASAQPNTPAPAQEVMPDQSSASPALSNTRTDCRNARYGEVMVVKGPVIKLRANIYNTLGLNDCPPGQWALLDSNQIKKQEHSFGVRVSGPRYFLMDSITIDKPGEIKTFGGLQMQLASQIKLNPSTAREQLQAPPYVETNITKNPQYEYDQGKPVYELVSPKGQLYIMQSYSLAVDPSLSEDKLPTLGSRLKLPTGWHYRVVSPDQDTVVGTSGGKARILQDDLQDTYYRLDEPDASASSPTEAK